MKFIIYLCGLIVSLPLTVKSQTGEGDLIAWWKFDEIQNNNVLDFVSNVQDSVEDNFKITRGVDGPAIKFDGFTTRIVRRAKSAPALGEEFTIEVWIGRGAYPWNWCPVVCHNEGKKRGYQMCIGPRGQVSVELAVNDAWQICATEPFVLPLRKWVHIAGVFRRGEGLSVFINGRLSKHLPVNGRPAYARRTDVIIGSVREAMKPSHIHREHGTLPSFFCLDGILDELKIYQKALDPEAVLSHYRAMQPNTEPDLPERKMPSGPPGPGRFGAYYTKLKYYEEWDALWPVDADPDVVVRFDETDSRVVFWRGTRYSAAWVTGSGLWMADQSVEAWNHGEADAEGCFEHMQDRHCRQSHVCIIESNAARVVVHWRYAPVSAYEHLWRINPKTGWACWVDEYYTIYPDGMGVRKVSWKTGTLGFPRQFQESLPLTHPGQLQSDVINIDFATVGNLRGEHTTLSFVKNPLEKKNLPEDLTIQIYNFKSANKPFIIFEPGNEMHYVKDRRLGPRGLDVPGACNHWPVGQARCDGRTVYAADRPTHFLGFPISYPPIHEKDDRTWWNGLYGMTDISFEQLAEVGRSWAYPPELTVKSSGFKSSGYDRGQRAYVLCDEQADSDQKLKFELVASKETPVVNPAFVVKNWGDKDARILINQKEIKQGRNLRIDHRYELTGADLIIWIKYRTTEPVSVEFHPNF